MAEWSIAAVLKTVEPKGSRGSNPFLSAYQRKKNDTRAAFYIKIASMDCNVRVNNG